MTKKIIAKNKEHIQELIFNQGVRANAIDVSNVVSMEGMLTKTPMSHLIDYENKVIRSPGKKLTKKQKQDWSAF